MAKQKFMVTRRWHGVNKGDIVEYEDGKVPDALRSNVALIPSGGTDHTAATGETPELKLPPVVKPQR